MSMFNRLRGFIHRVIRVGNDDGTSRGIGEAQEVLDLKRIVTLFLMNPIINNQSSVINTKVFTEDDVANYLADQFAKLTPDEQYVGLKRLVQSEAESRAMFILRNLYDCQRDQEQLEREMQKKQPHDLRSPINNFMINYKAIENSKAECIKNKIGYTVQVKRSSIQNAGDGLFFSGSCRPGSIVAFYPGTVFLPHHLDRIAAKFKKGESVKLYRSLFPEKQVITSPSANIATVRTYDGAIIDGTRITKPNRNLFAFGHKINHPPPETLPNVMKCPIVFPFDLPKEIMEFIPNEYFESVEGDFLARFSDIGNVVLSQDGKRRPLVRSIVFVALKSLQDGEELFVNYRFNPSIPKEDLPPWYHHVDKSGEDMLRWQM